MNTEQIAEISQETCMHSQGSILVSLPLGFCSITTIAYTSLRLSSSLSQESYAPTLGAFQTCLYSLYPLTTLDTTNARTVLAPYLMIK